jgi:hypothetical protein
MKIWIILLICFLGYISISFASDDVDGYEGRYCRQVNRSELPEPCADLIPDWVAVKSEEDYYNMIRDTDGYITAVVGALPDDNSTLGRCKVPLLTSICYDQLFSNCYGDECNDVAVLFRPCVPDPITGQAMVPPTKWPVCLDYCEYLQDGCWELFDSVSITNWFIPCSNFNNSATSYSSGAVSFSLECINYTVTNFTASIDRCPPDTKLDGQICSPACPSPVYSQEMYSSFSLMQQIVGWCSFSTAAVLLLLYLLHPRFRLFPSNIVMWLAVATMPLSLGFMLPSFTGSIDQVLCGDTESFSVQALDDPGQSIAKGGVCQFQGWLILYGSLSTAIWWALYGINTLHVAISSRMFKRTKGNNVPQQLFYHSLAWGIPLIACIIAISAGKLEYNLGYTYCFVSSSDSRGWLIGLWLVPIAICLLVGGICVVVAMVMINRMLNQASKKSSNKRTDQILMIVRTLVFLFVYWYFYTFIFAQIIWLETHRNQSEEDLVSYYFCLLRTQNTSDVAGYCRQKFLSLNQDQYQLKMVSDFNLACQGVILAAIFLLYSKVVSYCLFKAHVVDSYTQSGFSKSRSSRMNTSQIELNHSAAHSNNL